VKSFRLASVMRRRATACWLVFILLSAPGAAQQPAPLAPVELQPLAAQIKRLIETLDYLGAPLNSSDRQALEQALNETDAAWANRAVQDALDKHRLVDIHINPEGRVRVAQGGVRPELVERGWRTFLVKVRNEAGVTAPLEIVSANALPVHARAKADSHSPLSHNPRPSITESDVVNRWLEISLYTKPPMRQRLSGLVFEYFIVQLYSRDEGKREARLSFHVGQGTQDLGLRNEVDILFTCQPSTDVTLRVLDEQGKPATASFIIRDAQGHIYPSQAKRLAPDFAFQQQIYGKVNQLSTPAHLMRYDIVVDVAHDLVDLYSTVDTPSVSELNMWYHTLNAGFRPRIAGETDFPCIFGQRLGMGRSYVQLDGRLNFDAWLQGLRDGRAYVSEGKSHLMDFRVNGLLAGTRGSEIKLDKPETVRVTAKVAARLDEQPNEFIRGRRPDQQPYWDVERTRIGATREVPVEVVVNGQPVAKKNLLADGSVRELAFEIPLERSSWAALRIYPSAHTNPIFITVGGKPIRASRRSVEWLLKGVDQCWSQKAPMIAEKERAEAAAAYEHARQVYRRILAESDQD